VSERNQRSLMQVLVVDCWLWIVDLSWNQLKSLSRSADHGMKMILNWGIENTTTDKELELLSILLKLMTLARLSLRELELRSRDINHVSHQHSVQFQIPLHLPLRRPSQ
jgi:hypothetical protein